MTDDELVKKVARVMCETENGPCGCMPDECECTYWQASARAAIAVVLEAAAQVCVSPHGGWVSDDRLACADEIRALIG